MFKVPEGIEMKHNIFSGLMSLHRDMSKGGNNGRLPHYIAGYLDGLLAAGGITDTEKDLWKLRFEKE